MNVRSSLPNQELGERAFSVDFNNNQAHFSAATKDGFKLYTSGSCDLHTSQDVPGGAYLTKHLAGSQIVGLVSLAHPNKLNLYDFNLQASTASIALPRGTVILSVHLTRTHIAVATASQVHLYAHSSSSMTKVAAYDTCDNASGICVLGNKVCAFPGRSEGQIYIVRLPDPPEVDRAQVSILPAHNSTLRALCLSPEEDAVASASTTGTLIRLHSTSTHYRLLELRRGISPTTIHSLSISPTGSFLAATSATQTLHVFALPSAPAGGGAEESSAQGERGWTAVDHTPEPPAANSAGGSTYFGFQKWGSLARMPFAPRVFKDVYSVASASFDPGALEPPAGVLPPRRAVVGWAGELAVVVLSAGGDARYERFMLSWDNAGAAALKRVGWSRFLRPN